MKKVLKYTLYAVAAAAAIALLVWLMVLAASLSKPENQAALHDFIKSLGAFGVAFALALQILQVIVAIIPGEPLEILLGLMYGTVGGLILALIGIAIGQALVFMLVKKYGIDFAKRFVDTDKFTSLSFLKTESRRDSLIFLLFFIPGTPKDVLTYFAPFTGIKPVRFLVLATLARIPSVVSSTWAGATLSDGDVLKSAVIFAITGVIGAIGIFINNYITKRKNHDQDF